MAKKKRPKVMRKVLMYALKYKESIILLALLSVLSVGLSLIVSIIQGHMVDSATNHNEMLLFSYGLIIISILIIAVFCQLYQNLFMYKIGYQVARDMRKDLFNEVLDKPYEYFETRFVGEILQRTTSYVNDIGNYISKDFIPLVVNYMKIFFVFIFLLFVDIRLAFLVGGLLIILILVLELGARIMRKYSAGYKKTEMKRNSIVLEKINNFETLVAYNQSDAVLSAYVRASGEHYVRRRKFYLLHNSFVAFIEFLWNIAIATVYILSLLLIQKGYFEIGTVVACFSLVGQMLTPISEIAIAVNGFAKASGTADKVFEIFYESSKKRQRKNYVVSEDKCGIIFNNVTFEHKYNGIIVEDLTFQLHSKEKLLIRGHHGSGKSSIANLICRLYEPTSGKILLGGEELKHIDEDFLKKFVGIVTDDITIYNDSVLNNVRVAVPTASDEEVLNAINLSSLDKWSHTLHQGNDTIITPKAISSGDRCLMALARLILQKPKIVIVDEIARSMDYRAKRRFYKLLCEFTKDKTLVYISSHDEPQGIVFDKTITLDEGRMI